MAEEDSYVRQASGSNDPQLQNELRRLRSSVEKFVKSQQGLDQVLQIESDEFDQVAADKRIKNAKWLSDLVLRKIEKTLHDVEIAQIQMEL